MYLEGLLVEVAPQQDLLQLPVSLDFHTASELVPPAHCSFLLSLYHQFSRCGLHYIVSHARGRIVMKKSINFLTFLPHTTQSEKDHITLVTFKTH